MRTVTTLCAVLAVASSCVPAPAGAQSFYPNLAGARFCQLRAMGVSQQEAIRVAMSENWSQYRQPVWVTVNGERITTDAIDMARWAARCQ